jgi:N-acetylglucosaminyldiphosphoundecaprenol N-acetyl-beta-D-mannosaminyltransferase
LSPEENVAAIARINDAAPDIVWVGLGCPKQESWMLGNIDKLNGVVAIGVGAAFDFHSGRIARAPPWMRSKGLEWLHRLVCEPRRLWRRYLGLAPRFIVLSLADAWRSNRPFQR